MLARSAALLFAAPALFAAIPVIAQTADAPAKVKKVVDPNKKICRTVDTTGSIMMGTRVCHTKAEWTSIDQRNRDNVSSQRDLAGQGGNHQQGGFNP